MARARLFLPSDPMSCGWTPSLEAEVSGLGFAGIVREINKLQCPDSGRGMSGVPAWYILAL